MRSALVIDRLAAARNSWTGSGLTEFADRRDGDLMAEPGMAEVAHTRVPDKIGLVLSKIEALAFKTTLNPNTLQGNLPVHVSLFPRARLNKVLESMRPASKPDDLLRDLRRHEEKKSSLKRAGKGVGNDR